MNELFYRALRLISAVIFRIPSRPVILHRERAARAGAYILAGNHESPFDAPLLIVATPRVIYWLSIVEIFRNRFARWFLSAMLAAPLDRSRPDAPTMRRITRHLRAGRVVGIFPEGGLRVGENSVLAGGSLRDGIARLAHLAEVPVVPCVVLGGAAFHQWNAWLPFRRTRWAVAFGESIFPDRQVPRDQDCERVTNEIAAAMRDLHAELRSHE